MQEIEAKWVRIEDFMKLPDPIDGSRQELIRGVIRTMPPAKGRHGVCCAKIARLIGNFVDAHRLGIVTANDAGVILERNPDTVRGPDVAYWSYARQPTIPEGYFEIAPDLAVEVISPSNTRRQIREKIREYLFNGSRAVWAVDPEDRTVVVYRSPDEARLLEETAVLDGEEILLGFHCPVSELFR